MPTREDLFVAKLKADPTMVSLAPGGIYTDEEIGLEGIHRGADSNTDAAFDEKGRLKTCIVVRQTAVTPFNNVRSQKDKMVATVQRVEVYFYQHRGQDEVDAAKLRAYEVLEGERLIGTYTLTWLGESPFYYDVGPVANSTTLRQDWQVVGTRKPGTT
jgi:hypothetical protein